MQRYDLYESEMIDDSEGKYVLHDDAQSEIARLRAENERLRAVLTDAHGVICNQEDQLRRLVDCEDIACEGVILDIRAILPNASHQTAGGEGEMNNEL